MHPVPDSVAFAAVNTGLLGTFQSGTPGYTPNFLPFWEYGVQAAQDSNIYTGYVVGSNPTDLYSSTVQAPIVPVIVNITENVGGSPITWTWDPTQTDVGCLGADNTAYNLVWTSPLFTPTNFVLNGQFIGNTQYGDAVLRGEFWNYTGVGTLLQYERRLTLSPSQLPPVVITVNAGSSAAGWTIGTTQCGGAAQLVSGINPDSVFAAISQTLLDTQIQNYIATYALQLDQFPLFVLYKTMIFNGDSSNFSNCCIAGYHNVTSTGQTYGVADFEENAYFNSFARDISSASHVINEWINDPTGSNPAPAWGHVGFVSGCQNTFDVADPLVGTFMPPMTQDGFTYHLQEMAFFSWFFGGTNYGAGGEYSSNGTFTAPSTVCSTI